MVLSAIVHVDLLDGVWIVPIGGRSWDILFVGKRGVCFSLVLWIIGRRGLVVVNASSWGYRGHGNCGGHGVDAWRTGE